MKTFYVLFETRTGRTVKPGRWPTNGKLQAKGTTPYLWTNQADINRAIKSLSTPPSKHMLDSPYADAKYYQKRVRSQEKKLTDLQSSLTHAKLGKLDKSIVKDIERQIKLVKDSIAYDKRAKAAREREYKRELERANSAKFDIVPVQINI